MFKPPISVYKSAVFYDYKQPFKIETIKAPEVCGEQVLVKTVGCGLCHTDLHIWLGELPGLPEKKPCVLGHEPSGIVVAKGDAVPDYIKIGMPVLVQGAYYLEEDIYTLKGENVLATRPSPNWTGALGLYGGCYAEYFLVPSYRYLVPAEGLEDLAAAAVLTDAGLTPYRAVKKVLDYLIDKVGAKVPQDKEPIYDGIKKVIDKEPETASNRTLDGTRSLYSVVGHVARGL